MFNLSHYNTTVTLNIIIIRLYFKFNVMLIIISPFVMTALLPLQAMISKILAMLEMYKTPVTE